MCGWNWRGGGRITAVTPGVAAEGERLGCLLPAGHNLHSHAFQRAMAGMTERKGHPRDTFWTWRQMMFRFLDQLTPEDGQAIAAFVQMEMLEAGYASVCEFHYLHHQPGGVTYARLAEMAERIVAAAGETGIGLTLLPVAYEQGGCDGRALSPGRCGLAMHRSRFWRCGRPAGRRCGVGGVDRIAGAVSYPSGGTGRRGGGGAGRLWRAAGGLVAGECGGGRALVSDPCDADETA
ncbi:amidohydrolase family protein [Gemmobacter aquatilis]|uniref:amidohydrolase family protein n=1 Tax=Gemmobacter aquatilis TaxID=933059 RepID=UPI000ABA8DA4